MTNQEEISDNTAAAFNCNKKLVSLVIKWKEN